MALTPLDGTDPTVDLLVTFPSGTSGSSLRCIISGMEYDESRAFQNSPTLCSSNWVDELPGARQDLINFDHLASKGSIIADLTPLMGASNAANVSFVAGAGCSKSGLFWLGRKTMRVNAGIVAIPGTGQFRSKGPVTTAWVIT